MRNFVRRHRTEAPAVGAAVGMATLYVVVYVLGVIDRGVVFDPLLVVVLACIGLFIGWTLFALIGERQPDSGDDSDAGWSSFDRTRH